MTDTLNVTGMTPEEAERHEARKAALKAYFLATNAKERDEAVERFRAIPGYFSETRD